MLFILNMLAASGDWHAQKILEGLRLIKDAKPYVNTYGVLHASVEQDWTTVNIYKRRHLRRLGWGTYALLLNSSKAHIDWVYAPPHHIRKLLKEYRTNSQ